MAVGCQLHAPANLAPEKQLLYPLYRNQSRSEHCGQLRQYHSPILDTILGQCRLLSIHMSFGHRLSRSMEFTEFGELSKSSEHTTY
jgi:hypothetical protein